MRLPAPSAHTLSCTTAFHRFPPRPSPTECRHRTLHREQLEKLVSYQHVLLSDLPTLIQFLKACAAFKALMQGQEIHSHLIKVGLERDLFVANYLITMYGNCHSVEEALHSFYVILDRHSNVVSWTSIISVYLKHDECGHALSLFGQMLSHGVKPNKVTFSSILTACANFESLAEGALMHAFLVECGFEVDVVVRNALINMYAKCGAVENSLAVFDEMKVRDVVSWTAMIVGYSQNGRAENALQVFREMLHSNVMPNEVTLINILSACTSIAAVLEGRCMHAFIVEFGFSSEHHITNALLSLYGMCGCLDDASNTFWRMTHHDVSNWTTMIAMLLQHGYSDKAFHLFDCMQEKGIELNKIALITILNACIDHTFLSKGQEIHVCIVNIGYELDMELRNALLNMYSKCGSLENAEKTFYGMDSQDVVSWTSIIVAYVDYKLYNTAMEVFQSMIEQSIKLDTIAFFSILSACTQSSAFLLGLNVHARIVERGLESDVALGNSLLTMYGKCGSLINAQIVFDSMYNKNTISWNAIISFHVNSSHIDLAYALFQQMVLNGVKPDKVSFLNILSICVSEVLIDEGRLIHAMVAENGFEVDMEVANGLVMLYGKGGNVIDAEAVFDRFQHHNVVTWTSMIAAHAEAGNSKEVVNLFYRMQSNAVKPDKFTLSLVVASCSTPDMLQDGENVHASMLQNSIESDLILDNALINMYGKCGSLVKAQMVFDKVPEHDLFSFNAMIAAHAQHLHGKEAFHLLHQMQLEGIGPDKVSYLGVLSACSGLADLKVGKMIHALVGSSGLQLDDVVGNALVNMYSKCGSIDNAWRTFESLPARDIISWTTMVAAYAHHGCIDRALEVFDLMEGEGIEPNDVSFVSILSACSRAGSVEKALAFMERMSRARRIMVKPSHYGCMTDLLTRVGRLEEAEDFLEKWPGQPGVVDWMALLSASKTCGDAERGRRAAEHLLEIDQECAAAYVMLANACAQSSLGTGGIVYSLDGSWETQTCSLLSDHAHFCIQS